MTSRQFPRHDFPYHDFPYRDYPCADFPGEKVNATSKGRRRSPRAPAPGLGSAVVSLFKFLIVLSVLLIKIAVEWLSPGDVKRHRHR